MTGRVPQVTEAISLLSRLHAVRRRHAFLDGASLFFRQQMTFCGQDDPTATDVFDRALRENRQVGVPGRPATGDWALDTGDTGDRIPGAAARSLYRDPGPSRRRPETDISRGAEPWYAVSVNTLTHSYMSSGVAAMTLRFTDYTGHRFLSVTLSTMSR